MREENLEIAPYDAPGGTSWYYRTIETPILGIRAVGLGFMYDGHYSFLRLPSTSPGQRHCMHIDFPLGSSNTGLCGRSLHMQYGDACYHRGGSFGRNTSFVPIGHGFRLQISLRVRPKPGLKEVLSSSNEQRQKSRMHFYRTRCRSQIPHAYLSGVSRGFRIITLITLSSFLLPGLWTTYAY